MDISQQKELHTAKIHQLTKTAQGLYVMFQVNNHLKTIETMILSLKTPQDRNLVIDHITNSWSEKMKTDSLMKEIDDLRSS